jgi:hypothetical protein
VQLRVTGPDGTTSVHRSRRHGRVRRPPESLALTLTGSHATAFSFASGEWRPRARADVAERPLPMPTRDLTFCSELVATWSGARAVRAGAFGQLGLRDLRFASDLSGDPVWEGDSLVLTATHAGPGFFDTAHTGVWTLHPDTGALKHRSDLFFSRDDDALVYGDHSTHLIRDGSRWLVATSTWGDFGLPSSPAVSRKREAAGLSAYDPSRSHVEVRLAISDADLLSGRHVLATTALLSPEDVLDSVAVWDPHLVRDGDQWLLGFVTAHRFFSFHPGLAVGADLDSWQVRSVATGRVATEGTTLVRAGDDWRILASDGRDGRRGARKSYPVFDLDFTQLGRLDAAYGSNIPWPNVARVDDGWLLATFDGTAWGSSLLGYGTHGDVVVMRTGRPADSAGISADSAGKIC